MKSEKGARGLPLLEVKNLRLEFASREAPLRALRGVDFSLDAGERLGVVGESGAGKSLAAFAILNLIPPPGKITGGEILFEGRDLLRMKPSELRRVRGGRIAMIFQDPMTTLNPVLTVGAQMTETLRAHFDVSEKQARIAAAERLSEVAIPQPEARLRSYPHELSGGMRQRVVIAIALLTSPALIIADEPTTALDVTIQAGIMALLARLSAARKTALILITHDLGLVSQTTDRAAVMYAGKIVEYGATANITRTPRHPYTRGLIAALPRERPGTRRFTQIPGAMPPLSQTPPGCAFHPRCKFAQAVCQTDPPPPLAPLRDAADVSAACHFANDNLADDD
jgi:peptide/nickel transport system ATP-binding protein